eukprot:g1220.t1
MIRFTTPLFSAFLSFLLLLTRVETAAAGEEVKKIEHVVVAMLENRAFDHMLGFMKKGGPQGDVRVDGLRGDECNVKDISDPSGKGKICVNEDALDHCEYDPNHSFAATTERIFGCIYGVTNNTPCTDMKMTNGSADMSGFVASAIREGKDGSNEMTMWPPEKVPIITTLAKEFALFDRFFASHPGSTYPNRQFVLSGTAHGMTDTGNAVPHGGFPQQTVLRSFEDAGLSWKMYYEDSLAWAIFLGDVQRNESKPHIQTMDRFWADASAGTLPNFTFIEPRINPNPNASGNKSFGLANHQHPTSSVREGERWMRDIYQAVRASPNWESTLLIFTYDEHGGFYDHVSPPQVGVPSPDGICTKEGFDFSRLGVRIPTIAISPWIPKGTLVHEAPDAQKPFPTSEYELSSIPATLRKLFPELGDPLTKRDAWASTFEHVLSLAESRDDCPTTLPVVPAPEEGEMARQLNRDIDEHASGLMRTLCQLTPTSEDCAEKVVRGVRTYHDFAPWLERKWGEWIRP